MYRGFYVPNANTEHVHEMECGCFYETLHHPDGDLLELRVQICETHMAMSYEEFLLHAVSVSDQLTLELPSRDGRPGDDYGTTGEPGISDVSNGETEDRD